MSDLVALVCTVALALWFIGLSSVLVVACGGTWVPKAARQIARFADRPESRSRQRLRNVVSSVLLVLSQVVAVALFAGNLGRVTVSETLMLAAEPAIAAAWAAYLVRHAVASHGRNRS